MLLRELGPTYLLEVQGCLPPTSRTNKMNYLEKAKKHGAWGSSVVEHITHDCEAKKCPKPLTWTALPPSDVYGTLRSRVRMFFPLGTPPKLSFSQVLKKVQERVLPSDKIGTY